MKIVVLAAGEGVRMRPLTLETPKPLLSFGGKTCLDHLFEALPPEIDEAIITINYLAHRIREHCGSSFHGRKISYVTGSADGNARGFLAAAHHFAQNERFAVSYGDEVITRDEINACLREEFSWLCYEIDRPETAGIATLDEQGFIASVIEKPERPLSRLAVNGFMVANSDIFGYEPERHRSGEYYFSSLMARFSRTHRVKAVIGAADHAQLSTPADLARLDAYCRGRKNR